MMQRLLQIISLLALTATLSAQAQGEKYASSSVLATGTWFRIQVMNDGVYRINYSELKSLGLENPSNPVIFGNNAGQLSYFNIDPAPDDLREIPVSVSTGSDGIFNDGDYLLFYGQATGRWIFNYTSKSYSYVRQNYSDTAVYFLTSRTSPGKKVSSASVPSGIADYTSQVSDALFLHEKEIKNLIKSGREWFQPVSPSSVTPVNPEFTDIIPAEGIRYNIRVADRASISTVFRFNEGEIVHQTIPVQGINLYDYTGAYARIAEAEGSFVPASSSPSFEIKYFNNGEAGEHGWLDYVRLWARRNNIYRGGQSRFFDSRSVMPGTITGFSVISTGNGVIIWDVTDPFNVKNINYSRSGESMNFNVRTDSLRKFIAFTPESTLVPTIRNTPVKNQNLHASPPATMIIVAHPLFLDYAARLARFHEQNSGLTSVIVTPDQIYNEFSGGVRDIVAIRNFIRMKYLKQSGTSNPLKYLLLFGDGSYENKTLPPGNPNFIPTWQSQNSHVVVSSFTSDDFYGLLDDDEGESSGTEDIGIGRLPVSDTVQAGILISKIERYSNPANGGEWKNVITMVADDEDGNSHITDSEGLSRIIDDSVPRFNLDKIYLDAFRQVTSSGGESYPDVNLAINNRINEGCLILNYVGHGSETGLAHERIVTPNDIDSWSNKDRLPLFITATCEFSRFDDMNLNVATRDMTQNTSAGEMVLFNPDGGGIALMSTTRVVYSAPNYFLNRNIFDVAFERDSSGKALRLGDIIRIAKNRSGSGPNKRNFSLLGDPALRLAYPWYGKVVTDSISGNNGSAETDTIKALSVITVSGHIEDLNGKIASDFNGDVYPVVFDKENRIRTLANDGGSAVEFNLRNNILYRGKTIAAGGRFSFTFIVPRDINYSFGKGKISYYAGNENGDMNGSFMDLIVGGFTTSNLQDTTGPEIKLYMNDTLFRNGGITDKDPVLIALIRDEGGINTTGAGIGHDLTGYMDRSAINSTVLNNLFENDINDYTSGRITYHLSEIEEGSHTITVKAWDNYNNSSEKTISFVVRTGKNFVLNNLINYPNPFTGETKITAGHNRAESDLEITVSIFSLSGQLLKIIRTRASASGYALPPVLWDGRTDGGAKAGKGIYPYTVTVTTINGETARVSGRMIIL